MLVLYEENYSDQLQDIKNMQRWQYRSKANMHKYKRLPANIKKLHIVRKAAVTIVINSAISLVLRFVFAALSSRVQSTRESFHNSLLVSAIRAALYRPQFFHHLLRLSEVYLVQ